MRSVVVIVPAFAAEPRRHGTVVQGRHQTVQMETASTTVADYHRRLVVEQTANFTQQRFLI